jgi:nucleoid-associated protein YgaU
VADLKPSATAGAGQAGASAAGQVPMETVIIKRGDNLWRIARSAWGNGLRWTTIYQANTDQIRNPHWIYPGQIFIMPKGSAAWTDPG